MEQQKIAITKNELYKHTNNDKNKGQSQQWDSQTRFCSLLPHSFFLSLSLVLQHTKKRIVAESQINIRISCCFLKTHYNGGNLRK